MQKYFRIIFILFLLIPLRISAAAAAAARAAGAAAAAAARAAGAAGVAGAAGAAHGGSPGAARGHFGFWLFLTLLPFITSKKWDPEKCWNALRLDGQGGVYRKAVLAYRAWQLVRFRGYSPEGALLFVKRLEGYCLSPTDFLSKLPRFPPPVGYDGCRKCWRSLTDAEKRNTWVDFWIATGQLKFTNSDGGGGGGGGADTPAAGVAGAGPAGAK